MPHRVSWSVELAGDAGVLAACSRNLTTGFDPVVTYDPTRNVWCLSSVDFDVACDAVMIQQRAQPILAVLNGSLVALGLYGGMNLGSAIEKFSDGTTSVVVSLSGSAQIRSFVSAATVSTVPTQVPQQSMPQRWLIAAETDEIIEELLICLGRSDTWFDLYKVYECLKKLQNRASSNNFTGWWPASTLEESFRDTANFNRHSKGSKHYRIPNIVMSQDDAKRYIAEWSLKALQQVVP